jgi:hypothetical protein
MIKVEWGDRAETILRWTFGKQWTAEQLYAAVEHSNALVAARPDTVDVIAVMESILFVPSNLVTMATNGLKARPDNIGLIVIVSTSNFWRRIYDKASGLKELAEGRVRFARAEEEAYAIIGMQKARLAQLKTGLGAG